MDKKALVVLSGGQDSTTALGWAKHHFKEVHAITFNYGQRHKLEIESAVKVASILKANTHEIIDVGPILKSTSPLVSDNPVGHYTSTSKLPGGVEPTFVPGRNILFYTLAANRAAALGVQDIVTGLCQEDFGGYYDCRDEFVQAMRIALSQGIAGVSFYYNLHTPLMFLTKANSVKFAQQLGSDVMEALAYSHTCYDGMYPPNPNNHASLLRARGFHEAGVADPLIVRAKAEGLLHDNYPDSGLVEGTEFAKTMDF